MTLELSRRASGEYIKARVMEKKDELKEQAQLKAREKKTELKLRAQHEVRERTDEMKDRLLDSPWALGFIGGVVGTIAGRVIGKKTREARHGDTEWRGYDRPYDEYTATHAPAGYVGYGAQYSGNYGGGDYGRGYGSAYGAELYGGNTGYDANAGYEPSSGYDYNAGSYGGYDQQAQSDEGPGLKERLADKAQIAKERVKEGAHNLRDKAQDLKGNASSSFDEKRSQAEWKMQEGSGRVRENIDHLKHRAHDLGDSARDRLGNLSSKARGGLSNARDHIPSRHDVKHNAEDHPGIWALAAMAAGAFLGSMMPVSERERQAMAPIKSKARDRIQDLQSQAREKVETVTHEVRERVETAAGEIKESIGLSSESDSGSESESSSDSGNTSWKHDSVEAGPTYHASTDGGSYGPSYEAGVDRSSEQGGYGGGSVGVGDRGIVTASPDDEGELPKFAPLDDDMGATRH